MDQAKSSRRRAVRLSTPACEELERALVARWARVSPNRRLTREARAELFGVSPATADRIVAGKGVDRATLIQAFASVGLEWSDRYCAPNSEEAVSTIPSPTVAPTPSPIASQPYTNRGRTQSKWALAFGLVAAVVLGFPSTANDTKPYFRYVVDKPISDARNSYNRGDYSDAERALLTARSRTKDVDSLISTAAMVAVEADITAVKGDLNTAINLHSGAIAMHEQYGDANGTGFGRSAIAELMVKQRRFDEAAAMAQLAWPHFERSRNFSLLSALSVTFATIHGERRQFADADRWFAIATAYNLADQDPDRAADIVGRWAVVDRYRGRLAVSAEALESARSHWRSQGHLRWIAKLNLELGRTYAQMGRIADARSCFQAAQGGYDAVGDRLGYRHATEAIASVSP